MAVPLLLSLEKKVFYASQWRWIFPAIALTALYFIGWDVIFTRYGVWGFNATYVLGRHLLFLPIEEVLFFICIPFACLFIYCIVRQLLVPPGNSPRLRQFLFLFSVVLLVTGVFSYAKIYTAVTCISLALLLLWLLIAQVKYLGTFTTAYLIQVLPFGIVNGILTALPVVTYNEAMNSGWRVYTIPVEDFAYSALLMLMNVALYEWLKARSRAPSAQ